jgi:hypothetical protein
MQRTPECPCNITPVGVFNGFPQKSTYEQLWIAKQQADAIKKAKEDNCCDRKIGASYYGGVAMENIAVTNTTTSCSQKTMEKIMKASAVHTRIGTGNAPIFSTKIEEYIGTALGTGNCQCHGVSMPGDEHKCC